ncbi:unnamed protein product [Rotaria sp. Silwood1]|nr:unnamed protein product [Rotaria sp. Silwood1]CAF1651772.1 unnamed protein product [Rotaria sp. Silwood1]
MENLYFQLNDLPDEILMIILKNMTNVEVLFSLMDVNKRLNKIVHDETFTNYLTFLVCSSDSSVHRYCDSLIDRFCLQILPSIHHKIQWLNLEASSMKRILFATDYPNLRGLGLYNVDDETVKYVFNVYRFDECLYLLDGRFNQLHTFYVSILAILPLWSEINQQVELRNLKCFSLYCESKTYNYDELIVPLLHRMLNLEELDLYLQIIRFDKGFIDGNNMKKNIINRMPRLNKFIFNIRSIILSLQKQINLPSNEDIQQTFKDFQENQIISSVDYFSEEGEGQCHVYSYPYTMQHYHGITNNFSGGLFEYVYDVSLFDERPFQHEFFLRISQSFPFMRSLSLTNNKPQNDKLCHRLNDNDHNLSVIKYLHLNELILHTAHDDYIEQFLVDTKTYLQNDIYLSIKYESLQRVTRNFSRNTTRINCAKLSYIGFIRKPEFLPNLSNYFPHAEIL